MRRANYPPWLSRHLKPGIYANKTTTGYTLYRAHNVYDPTIKKGRRICDEVLGRVTEKDGFIPKKPYKVPVPSIDVFLFGQAKAVLDLTGHAFQKPLFNLNYFKIEILVGAILLFLNHRLDVSDFRASALSVIFPKTRFNLMHGVKIYPEIERGAQKIKEMLKDTDLSSFKYVYLLRFNNNFQVVGLSDYVLNSAKEKGVSLNYEKK